ncbi:MAG: YceI family protein [Bacteroidetes bacterium]|nr:MAG: YceI family protein [Bacteroidota bacterium]MBL1145090.1 YceI family protein [Bacteroidota bacterium]NOG57887.1 YceI family protein [Bacteroidota bacterium]
MKKITGTILAMSISFLTMATNGEKKVYKVDQKVSSVEWLAKKVTGSHDGTITIEKGEIEETDGMITGGIIHIDMNGIVVTDIKDKSTNAKLLGHLMSDDFFGVKDFPSASLKINDSKQIEGNKHLIMGDLTIKGKTHPIEIPTTLLKEDGKLVAIGEATVDRTKYDIKYGSGQFFEGLGDRMIYDEFTVKFKVGAK